MGGAIPRKKRTRDGSESCNHWRWGYRRRLGGAVPAERLGCGRVRPRPAGRTQDCRGDGQCAAGPACAVGCANAARGQADLSRHHRGSGGRRGICSGKRFGTDRTETPGLCPVAAGQSGRADRVIDQRLQGQRFAKRLSGAGKHHRRPSVQPGLSAALVRDFGIGRQFRSDRAKDRADHDRHRDVPVGDPQRNRRVHRQSLSGGGLA